MSNKYNWEPANSLTQPRTITYISSILLYTMMPLDRMLFIPLLCIFNRKWVFSCKNTFGRQLRVRACMYFLRYRICSFLRSSYWIVELCWRCGRIFNLCPEGILLNMYYNVASVPFGTQISNSTAIFFLIIKKTFILNLPKNMIVLMLTWTW